MQYQLLGKTGTYVSPLCMGTMSFGGEADVQTSEKMFLQCLEHDIRFFDCADVYQKGGAEKILGKLIKKHQCRDRVFITSKVYFRMDDDINAMGASRYHIRRAIDQSLQRLDTDYIDLYFIHRFDERTPLEETLHVFHDLVRQGKVLYIGASNFAAWQVAKGLGISEKNAWASFQCIQPMYNLVKRQAEVELLPLALSEQLGVTPYSPLGGGLLSGKYRKNKKPDQGRLVQNMMYATRYGEEWVYDTAESFCLLADELGYHPVSLAVAWVAAHPAVTAPILGARNPGQLQASLDALQIKMTPELYQRIADLSPTPPPATDRIEERSEHNYGLR